MSRTLLSFATLFVMGIPCVGQERQPFIINGLPTDQFPAVGIVGEASVGGFCTGTLITPTHVLTAAHCAEAILRWGDENSGTFELDGRVYRTTQVQILPSYDGSRFTDDVAILVLDEPVIGVEPALLSDVPPEIGEQVTIVGYGGQGTPELGSDGSFGAKLVGYATVDNLTMNEISWVFDDAAESNPAPGDSGGPVFVQSESGWLLAGIVSSGTTADAQLGDISFSMRVDAYEPWITEVVLATTASEVLGPPDEVADGNVDEPESEAPAEDNEIVTPEVNPPEEAEAAEDPSDVQQETVDQPNEDDDSAVDDVADDSPTGASCTSKPAGHRGRPQGHRYGDRRRDCAKPPFYNTNADTTEASSVVSGHKGSSHNNSFIQPPSSSANRRRSFASRFAPTRPARGSGSRR